MLMKKQRKSIQTNCYLTQMTAFSLNEQEIFEYGEANFNCLIIILKGSLKCSYIEDIILNKGDSVILTCNHSLRLKSEEKQVKGYILEYQTNEHHAVYDKPNDYETIHGKPIQIKPFSHLVIQLEKLYENVDHPALQTQLTNQISFLQLLEKVLHAVSSSCELGDAVSLVNKSIDYIHSNYMKKLTVEQLAQNANVSVRQYLRIFKKITAATPVAYINQYRVYRAQELLLQKDDSVQKIALDVGFDDVNYFNRIFKQKVGCAPKEYIRLKHKNPRIVTIHYTGELLALGIVPIADLKTTLMQVYQLPEGINQVGEMTCDIEKIKELNPDIVILSDAIECDVKEQIEKFVPLIVIPWDMDPITRLQQIAKVMGKTVEASHYISTYEQKRKEMKLWCSQQNFQAQSTTILRLDEGKVWIHAARFFPLFYEVLPLKPSQLMLETTESEKRLRRYDVPFHQLSAIESDRIYIVLGIERQFSAWLKQLICLKEWQQLRAVKNDEVYILRQQGLANSIYNQQNQLKELPVILSGQAQADDEGLLIGKLSMLQNVLGNYL